MVTKAQQLGISLRPHFKTHQSREIGQWFKSFGVTKIAVSSLAMADYFAEQNQSDKLGWQDICVAFPFNPREITLANKLAEKIELTLLVANIDSAKSLVDGIRQPVNVMIKIDFGYRRSGIDFQDNAQIDKVINCLSQNTLITFSGFMSHSGHTYKAKNIADIGITHQECLGRLALLKSHYRNLDVVYSYGDTPSFSTQNSFDGVDELRPGNIVFYDFFQSHLGVCKTDQIAVALACPIIDLHPQRGELVVQGGAVHLSKDAMQLEGKTIYGLPVMLTEAGWSGPISNSYVKSLSQEHGIISMPAEYVRKFKVGELVGILPVHSCLSADIHTEYLTIEGKRISKFRTY